MSAAKPDAAALLRQRREQFEFARDHDCSMAEARKRIAQTRWKAADLARQGRRASTVLCGTGAPRFASFIDASQPPEREETAL